MAIRIGTSVAAPTVLGGAQFGHPYYVAFAAGGGYGGAVPNYKINVLRGDDLEQPTVMEEWSNDAVALCWGEGPSGPYITLSWTGNDPLRRLNTARSFDGMTFTKDQTFDETCLGGPAVVNRVDRRRRHGWRTSRWPDQRLALGGSEGGAPVEEHRRPGVGIRKHGVERRRQRLHPPALRGLDRCRGAHPHHLVRLRQPRRAVRPVAPRASRNRRECRADLHHPVVGVQRQPDLRRLGGHRCRRVACPARRERDRSRCWREKTADGRSHSEKPPAQPSPCRPSTEDGGTSGSTTAATPIEERTAWAGSMSANPCPSDKGACGEGCVGRDRVRSRGWGRRCNA